MTTYTFSLEGHACALWYIGRTYHVISHVLCLIFGGIAPGTSMETASEVSALSPPNSELDTAEETRGDVEEPPEAVLNEDGAGQPAASAGLALAQSSLLAYRTPVLPNLAKAALERLQKRNAAADLEDSQNSDFQPLKRRRVDENTHSEGEENEVADILNDALCIFIMIIIL